jgi:hypothetical protein
MLADQSPSSLDYRITEIPDLLLNEWCQRASPYIYGCDKALLVDFVLEFA